MLGKRALQTGVDAAQDVLAGENVKAMLTKRSRETIDGVVPQSGSSRKSTKRKMHFRDLPPLKKCKTVLLDQDQCKTTFNFSLKFKWDSPVKL